MNDNYSTHVDDEHIVDETDDHVVGDRVDDHVVYDRIDGLVGDEYVESPGRSSTRAVAILAQLARFWLNAN